MVKENNILSSIRGLCVNGNKSLGFLLKHLNTTGDKTFIQFLQIKI